MMLSHVLVDLFIEGGPIMWPITIVMLFAVAVVSERMFWWVRASAARQPKEVARFFDTLESGDIAAAESIAAASQDPVLRVVREGLAHREGAFHGALQSAAGEELRAGARFLTALDTIITLAPLLGLLGTVTGIMASFTSLGDAELAIDKVTGGIGEALIATAFGLGIAIFTLIPYNWCHSKLTRLQQDLEFAANSLEVLLAARGWRPGPAVPFSPHH